MTITYNGSILISAKQGLNKTDMLEHKTNWSFTFHWHCSNRFALHLCSYTRGSVNQLW